MDLNKARAPYNRTLSLTADDVDLYQQQLLKLSGNANGLDLQNRIIHQDLCEAIPYLPQQIVDLLFLDPPYNLTKSFNGKTFRERSHFAYAEWLESWLPQLMPLLKPTASVYICGDWRSSSAIYTVASQYLTLRNRITWEREKGRGAKHNWKNCSEDIWFATVSDEYTFHADAVRLKRRVLAPYTDDKQDPKDWDRTPTGNYRLTYASNLWTDLTVPFWSMPENTDHPTQKPEKLLAKIILASSNPHDLILDPFLGSGTTAVTAQKLGRNFIGIEQDLHYCCLALKRLAIAQVQPAIQGYQDEVFWERNSKGV